jgi:hypothetical protein
MGQVRLRAALLSGISTCAVGLVAQTPAALAQQSGWTCSNTSNLDLCRNSQNNQLMITVTGVGSTITQTNGTVISTTDNYQPGIVLQSRPQFDGNGQPITYTSPEVIFRNTAAISTRGEGSAGLSSWGLTGNQTIRNDGTIDVGGRYGVGIMAVSGSAGVSAAAGGGTPIAGGRVTVENTARIVANGESGMGIYAASGGLSYYGNYSVFVPGTDVSITNSGAVSGSNVAIFGQSGGGNVTITNSGALAASGWSGIAAQSWDGNVTINNTGAITMSGDNNSGIAADVNRGSGSVTVTNSGRITLTGNNAQGINAQTVTGPMTITNSGTITGTGQFGVGINAGSGSGGGTVTHSGRIDLGGAGSTGISAFGGLTVRSSGDVITRGANSYGIFAGTLGSGGTTIDITGGTVQGGSGATTLGTQSRSGQGDGTAFSGSAGVMFLGGQNQLTNRGTITAHNGLAIASFDGPITIYEWDNATQREVAQTVDIPVSNNNIRNYGNILGAIQLGAGADSIVNSGRITGNIDMGGGTNSLSNLAGGVIEGTRIAVGAGNTFTNGGDLSPGGRGTIAQTMIIGNFVQVAGGRMIIDINETAAAGSRSDTISVTGTASLGGVITPNVMDMNRVVASEYRVLTAAGGITNNGITTSYNVTDTVGYDFGIDRRGANDLFLTARRSSTTTEIANQANTASGATGASAANIAALGTALGQLETAGGSTATTVLNAVRLQDGPASAAKVMDRIIPHSQSGQTSGTTGSGAAFGNAMLSCASRDGEYAYTREDKCYYAKLTIRQLEHGASTTGAGVTETATEAVGGIQFDIGGQRRLGLAFGYEDIASKSYSQSQSLGSSDGQRLQGGLVLKDQWGAFNAYLNLTGSYGMYDNKRFVNLGGFSNALSDQTVTSAAAKLRLSYLYSMGSWYAKPLIDMGVSYVHLGGYTERDAGNFNLKVSSADKTIFSIMPGLEVGGQIRDGSGTIWRPYARAGVTFFSSDSMSVAVNFANAPVGINAFNVQSKLDTVFADVEAGTHVLMMNGLSLRLNYEGRYGENTRQHGGTIKLGLPY